MTPAQLKKARHALGLSAEGFARLVGVKSGRTVRRWESGEREIPGPVMKLTEHYYFEEMRNLRRRVAARG